MPRARIERGEAVSVYKDDKEQHIEMLLLVMAKLCLLSKTGWARAWINLYANTTPDVITRAAKHLKV